jgi:hypothetical protein
MRKIAGKPSLGGTRRHALNGLPAQSKWAQRAKQTARPRQASPQLRKTNALPARCKARRSACRAIAALLKRFSASHLAKLAGLGHLTSAEGPFCNSKVLGRLRRHRSLRGQDLQGGQRSLTRPLFHDNRACRRPMLLLTIPTSEAGARTRPAVLFLYRMGRFERPITRASSERWLLNV